MSDIPMLSFGQRIMSQAQRVPPENQFEIMLWLLDLGHDVDLTDAPFWEWLEDDQWVWAAKGASAESK